MKRMRSLGLRLLVFTLVSGCAGHVVYAEGPYRGQVRDAETKAPLEGAAVLVVWTKNVPVGAHMPTAFVDAIEVVTDSKGEFTIPRTSHLVALGRLLQPEFVIYYPGYGYYPVYQLQPTGEAVRGAFRDLTVVELPRWRTRKERLRILDINALALRVPKERMPVLTRLVNEERQSLDLPATELGR